LEEIYPAIQIVNSDSMTANVLLSLLLVVAVASTTQISLSAKVISTNTVDLLTGFASGCGVKIANVTLCTQSSSMTTKSFDDAATNIDMGYTESNPGSILVGFQSFGTGLQEIASAFKNCNVPGILDDLSTIGNTLYSRTEDIIYVDTTSLDVIANSYNITYFVKLFEQLIVNNNYEGGGDYAGQIFDIIRKK
jgi:hypothetical protein